MIKPHIQAVALVVILALSGCAAMQEPEKKVTLPDKFTFHAAYDTSGSSGDRNAQLWLSFDGDQVVSGRRRTFASNSQATRSCDQELDPHTLTWNKSLARAVTNYTRELDDNGTLLHVNTTWTPYELNASCHGPLAPLNREELQNAIIAGNYTGYPYWYEITNTSS
jgi:hypothetical protein